MSANAELVEADLSLPNTIIASSHKSLLETALGLAIAVTPTETQAGTFALRISHLHAGSAALLSGSVRPNDVLIAINGTKVRSIADAERALQTIVADGARHVPVLLCRRMPREKSASLRGMPPTGVHANGFESNASMLPGNVYMPYQHPLPNELQNNTNTNPMLSAPPFRGVRISASNVGNNLLSYYKEKSFQSQQQTTRPPVLYVNDARAPHLSPNFAIRSPLNDQHRGASGRRSSDGQFVTERHAAAWNQNNLISSVSDRNQQYPPNSPSRFAASPSGNTNLSRRRSIHSVTPLTSAGASSAGSASPVLPDAGSRQPMAQHLNKLVNSPLLKMARLPRKFPKYFALFMLNTSAVCMSSSSPTNSPTSLTQIDDSDAASTNRTLIADDAANKLPYVHPQSNSSILKNHGAFVTLWQLCADLRLGRPNMLTLTVAEREVQVECCALPNDDKTLFLALSKRTSLYKLSPLPNLILLLEFLYGNAVLALEHPLFTVEATNIITDYIAMLSASSTPPCPDGNYECDLIDDELLRGRIYAALNRLQSEICGPSTTALPLSLPFPSPSVSLDVLPVWCRGVCLLRRPHQQQIMLLLTTLPEHTTRMCILASRLSRSVFPNDNLFMRELYRTPAPALLTSTGHDVYRLHAASTSYLLIVKVGELSLVACIDALMKNLVYNLTLRNRIYQHALSVLHEIVQHLARARHQGIAQRAQERMEMLIRIQRGGLSSSSRSKMNKQPLAMLRSKSAENLSFSTMGPDAGEDDDDDDDDAGINDAVDARTASNTNLNADSRTVTRVMKNAETLLANPCLVALTNRHNVSVATDLLESYKHVLSQPMRQLPRLLLPSLPNNSVPLQPTSGRQDASSTYYAEFGISCTIKNKDAGTSSSTSDLLNKFIHPTNNTSSSNSRKKKKSNKANIFFQISAATCPSSSSNTTTLRTNRAGDFVRGGSRRSIGAAGGRSMSAGPSSTNNTSNYHDPYSSNNNGEMNSSCDIRYSARSVIVPDLRAENQCALRRYGFRTSFA